MKRLSYLRISMGTMTNSILYLRTKVLHSPILCTLHSTHGKKNLNSETQKSEQTLFAQISLSQY